MKNYSRQRQAVLKVLKASKSHPTAASVYEEVRKEIPNISLGTVYRNLAALTDNGDVLSLAVGDGQEHFDGDNSPHVHLYCRSCGKIEDLCIENDPARGAAEQSGFECDSSVYIVYGRCKICKN